MSIFKSTLASLLAGGAAITVSVTALANTAPTPSATATPAPTPTPTPAAGPLTISLICDTGPSGSGTFTVTANAKSSTVSVKCGKSTAVPNAAWKAGSSAVIHQTVAPGGALKARDVSITLKSTRQSVVIRDFRPAATSAVATLAQTGGGLPALPIGLGLTGLLLVAVGARALTGRAERI